MKKYIILLLSIAVAIFSSCSRDYELHKSIFINDNDSPGLPEYSEWGYNTFGAYIDRKPFTSNKYDLPAKIVVNHDTLNITFTGSINENNYKYASIKFSFKGYSLSNYKELSTLNGKSINLKSDDCIVSMTRMKNDKDTTIVFSILEGVFIFNKVQNLYIDREFTQSILSGHFSLKAINNQEPISISEGRFDVGIGNENFFNY